MNALLLSFALAAPAAPPAPTPPEGVRPVGAAGKPLNLDFEDGTLTHWTATGDAFKDQPVKGWWGKLDEESGRGLLVKDGGEKFVKPNDWNDYVVEAVGPAVKIWINGEKVADYTDEKLARRGLIGFQVHSGGPTEVRFRDLRLNVIRK